MNSPKTPFAVISPGASPDALEAKQPHIDHGTEVYSKEGYFSRDYMALEWDRLWTQTWLIAGMETDIPQSGDYFLFDIGDESIIITRTEEGIKAFYNVCSHRGAKLVWEERGNRKVFVCPFHSWSFHNNGELRRITDEDTFQPDLIAHRPGLQALACETHAGIIFISMAEDPAPLAESIGLPEGYLEGYRLDQMKVVRHVRSEWGSNWKVGVEAFYESYHLHAVHPETRGIMGDLNVQYDLYPNGASRMIVPLGQPSPRFHDQHTVTEGLEMMLRDAGVDPADFTGDASEVRRAMQLGKRERAARLGLDYSHFEDSQLSDSWATGVFPNVQIGCHPEAVFLMRFLPHETDPERFYYDTMTLLLPVDDPDYCPPAWMGLPEGTDVSGRVRPATEHYSLEEDADLGMVLSQDADFLPVVQKGMRSRGFKGQLWGEQEQRLRHFHVELQRYLSGN
ncbi:aromatic ring-hydroxylating dioxygenase subunit alpha [Halieaceae bacterium IMCC14734]|uniref:Aromatic ring-hydroxylating dioxygenase subunit alpha n=1 Tax=Candidatus Litorirhabdus singularis TaxID=2518993 RepID=A0ABT3TKQ9_9GAMM|nr:aromatic ring-hydroxylating dioxygenase subunit alpha [Candidatus Litorirhabdus singularis]MCX2982851.1 aromatic ring-hydroxylating dioxygenase subunit alpha [Candidatus Litorirhabdus singularis]